MDSAKNLIWLVLGFPLVGALILGLLGRKLPKAAAGGIGTLAVAASFVLGLIVTQALAGQSESARQVIVSGPDWISILGLRVPFEWTIDPLSMLMVLIITGIGALIHLYSTGYMSEERDFSRFFCYLNLFVAAMLVLVLGNNLPLLFIGWEGVGLCSYLLIGFWYTDLANVRAANKAFIVNRIGDWSFMLGMFLIVVVIAANREAIQGDRYLSYDQMLPALGKILQAQPGMATAIALLLFFGAAGKSAQFPLYFWLPDAMAGPTPVSALIHAATMVTSGVVLLNRMNVVFTASPTASAIVCVLGAFTAVFAALIAFGQSDIKKVLAYSTVSQLGYMFLGCGAGAYWTGMFHVTTHAFFKALLFLGAGAVIHAMAHDQDMRNYGGLRKYLPITFFTMVIAWLAIAGVPLLSGYYSKDAILGAAYNNGATIQKVAGGVGLFTAFLTALYMTRMMSLTFFGKEERWRNLPAHTPEGEDHEGAHMDAHDDHHHGLTPDHKPHEVPFSMRIPLIVLAILSLAGGFVLHQNEMFQRWLEPVSASTVSAENHTVTLMAGAAAIVGIVLGVLFYAKGLPADQGYEENRWWGFRRWQRDQFGYDGTVTTGAVLGGGDAARALSQIDRNVIDGAFVGTGALATRAGGFLRGLQSGLIRLYAFMMLVGAVGFIAWFIFALSRGGAQ